MLKLWRELLVSMVTVNRGVINVKFEDSIVTLQMNKKCLKQHGIEWKHITEGRRILIKGREGNEDVHLMRLDALEGIVLIPEKK